MKPLFTFQNHILTTEKKHSLQAVNAGIKTWHDALSYIATLPYGRNKNRRDLSLVIDEQKGTCSSKHALLKAIALENRISNVHLILAIYKMNGSNTVGIHDIMSQAKLEHIPEAHCFLEIDDKYYDFTFRENNMSTIENDILETQRIAPHQVTDYKVNFHCNYLKSWIEKNNIAYTFEQIWDIRERCIQSISEHNTNINHEL